MTPIQKLDRLIILRYFEKNDALILNNRHSFINFIKTK